MELTDNLVGKQIEWNNRKYKVFAYDPSGAHPSGTYRKWDYILEDENGNWHKVLKAELIDIRIVE